MGESLDRCGRKVEGTPYDLSRGRIVHRYRDGQEPLAARPGGERLVVRQHEERDRCVLAGDGDDDERVKDLVVTERSAPDRGGGARRSVRPPCRRGHRRGQAGCP
jgi:hypothetical protein